MPCCSDTVRPSVKARCALIACGGLSRPTCWRIGTTNLKKVRNDHRISEQAFLNAR